LTKPDAILEPDFILISPIKEVALVVATFSISPEEIKTEPVFPYELEPELIIREPLSPCKLLVLDAIITDPLGPESLEPLINDTLPPGPDKDWPPAIDTEPPEDDPETPSPPDIETVPPSPPPDEKPADNEIEPPAFIPEL